MNRELLHELLDTVLTVQDTGDFASIQVSNYGYEISILYISGGFKSRKKGYDYTFSCDIEDTEKLQEAIDYLKNIKKPSRREAIEDLGN